MAVSIEELRVGDVPQAWRDAGFQVDGDVVLLGSVRIRLVGREHGHGILGWTLSGLPEAVVENWSGDLEGIPTGLVAGASDASRDRRTMTPHGGAPDHPNGVTHIDHVVLLAPDLDRVLASLARIGLEPRRTREGRMGGAPVRQVFYRLGEVILEVVGSAEGPGEGEATLWGLTHTVADLDAAAGLLGAGLGPVKDAVQPGRRIATLRHRDLGLSVATALITPHVKSAG